MTRLVNLGCKLNQYEGHCLLTICQDGNIVKDQFLNKDDPAPKKIVIVNTCVVTKEAERKSLKRIRQAVRQQPKPFIIVTGCLAEKWESGFEGVDLILKSKDRHPLMEKVFPQPRQTRYFLKIQDGCDSGCSYCIVPLVRGRHTSIAQDRIISEIEYARDRGYPEIVLTGVNLGYYGKEFDGSLVDLLRRIGRIPSLPRLRLSSLEPQFLIPEIFALFNDLPLCKHLHLPVQSGDPDVLQSMHRFYDINKLRKMMDLIQTRFPQFAFGADFITGFPTEDRQSFEKTFEFIRTAPFSYLHIFPYSPRPGTRAFPLGDPVKPEEKHSRVKLLRALGREKSYDFRKRFINQKFMITVERRNGKTSGLTENYIRMIIPAKPYENLIEAQIVKVEFDYTLGKIV